jgi:hypothetical protein
MLPCAGANALLSIPNLRWKSSWTEIAAVHFALNEKTKRRFEASAVAAKRMPMPVG